MEQQPGAAAATAVAFAGGLRRTVTAGGRRWRQWPAGESDLATVLGAIDAVQLRLQSLQPDEDPGAAVAACIADLRAVLEWTTYQGANISTVRALDFARKTRAFAERFGVIASAGTGVSVLVDSERSLIKSVADRNGFMTELAERAPHLGLPRPLIDIATLAAKPKRPEGKLAFIQRLRRSTKEKPRR